MLYVFLGYVATGLAICLLVFGKDRLMGECKKDPIVFMLGFPILVLIAPVCFIRGIVQGITTITKKEGLE